MRALIFLLLLSSNLVLMANPSVSDGGWSRKTHKRNPPQGGAAVNLVKNRGPQYSQPNAPPTAAQIPNLIAASDPNSPNQIAAQGLGFSNANCGHGVKDQMQALLAQLASITAQLNAEQAAISGCGVGSIAAANCAIAHGNAALAIANKAIPIAAQLQALSAQPDDCSGSGSTAQAQPGTVTLANVAKRFNVPLAGVPNSGANLGLFGGGAALQQLQNLAQQGELADFDGRSPAVGKALGDYQAAATRAMQLGPRVEAGRQLAKTETDYSNPDNAAQEEYLKINYKELGSKYDALAQGRAVAADHVAAEALANLAAPAPVMDNAPALIQPEVPDEREQAGHDFSEKAADSLWEGMKDKLYDNAQLSVQGRALDKTLEIYGKVGKMQDLVGPLYAALNELGSASLSTASSDALLAKLDKYTGDVRESVAQPNPFKMIFGGGTTE